MRHQKCVKIRWNNDEKDKKIKMTKKQKIWEVASYEMICSKNIWQDNNTLWLEHSFLQTSCSGWDECEGLGVCDPTHKR